MNAFVINLKSRPDRWGKIQKRFANSDMKLTRIDAIKSGAHGCFLSFIKALKLAKRLGLPEVLILEDDCLPVAGWKSKWRRIHTWLSSNPDKWDLYSGGAHKIIWPEKIGHADGINYYNPAWSIAAHWLYIPERSYTMLLEHYTKVSGFALYNGLLGIDVHNNLFKTVISCPFIAYQDSGVSNVRGTYRDTKQLFIDAEADLCTSNRRKTIRVTPEA